MIKPYDFSYVSKETYRARDGLRFMISYAIFIPCFAVVYLKTLAPIDVYFSSFTHANCFRVSITFCVAWWCVRMQDRRIIPLAATSSGFLWV